MMPIAAASTLTMSVMRYSHAMGCCRTSLSRKANNTINSPIPNSHKYSRDVRTKLHSQRRAVMYASQALPRHQPPMVMVMKAVTFQAKTGASISGKK